MTTIAQNLKRVISRSSTATAVEAPVAEAQVAEPRELDAPPVDIAPDDPILAYFQSAPGAVDIEKLELDSPALDDIRAAGIKLVVPLVSQGELIGLLNLGPRLSEQAYSSDDRKLLDNLAAQAAPAVRVAQLVREQQTEARARERIEHELQVAQPHPAELPAEGASRPPRLGGRRATTGPRATVGGDFYDFIELAGRPPRARRRRCDRQGRAGRDGHGARPGAILRASRPASRRPGEVLERVNELLVPGHAGRTCSSRASTACSTRRRGMLRFANAGHNLPYVAEPRAAPIELRATGMPLGLMPEMRYEEKEAVIAPGESILLYSDGLTEAHDPRGRCSASRGSAPSWERSRQATGSSTASSPSSSRSPARAGSRRTTSRSWHSGAAPEPCTRIRPDGGRSGAGRVRRSERTWERAGSDGRASRLQSRSYTFLPSGSSASRPPSPRQR